ncbi:MAG TPA: hypothetical protein VFA09_23355 [Ktedonobacteraceae bacterium]|nr:hypothetical protein [Ktedonobacteraceae bacterium]
MDSRPFRIPFTPVFCLSFLILSIILSACTSSPDSPVYRQTSPTATLPMNLAQDNPPTSTPTVHLTPSASVPAPTPAQNPTPASTSRTNPTPAPTPTATQVPPGPTPSPTAPGSTPTPTPTPSPTPAPLPSPTPTPTQPGVFGSGTWQDPYGGASYTGDGVTMQLTVQGSAFSGTYTGFQQGNSTPVSGQDGPLSLFSADDQQYLNYVIQNWGYQTGVFLIFTNSNEFEGAPAGSEYYAVVAQNGDIDGFWYFPNPNNPYEDAGALQFNQIG